MRIAVALCLLAAVAAAGGGPMETVVVANGRSPVSRALANAYLKERGIPPSRLVLVDEVPPHGLVSVDDFLEKIWAPLEPRLARATLVVYSADLPYGVDFRARLSDADKKNRIVGGVASLTGATYLAREIVDGAPFWAVTRQHAYYGGPRPPRNATAAERRLFANARAAMARKNYREAARVYAEFLKTYDVRPEPWYDYACALARLGRKDDAFAALGRAADAGWNRADHTKQDPDLAPLRGDARFAALLARLGGGGPPPGPSEAFPRGERVLAVMLGTTGPHGNSLPELLRMIEGARARDGAQPDGTFYFCRSTDRARTGPRVGLFAPAAAALRARGRKAVVMDGVLPEGKDDVLGVVMGIAKFSWAKSGSRIVPGAFCDHLTSHAANFRTPGQTKVSEFLRHGAAGSAGTVTEPLNTPVKFPHPFVHVWYADGLSLAEAAYKSLANPYQTLVVGDGLARPFATFGGDPDEVWVNGRFHGPALDEAALPDGVHEIVTVAVADDAIGTRTASEARVVRRGEGPALELPAELPYGAVFDVRADGWKVELRYGGRAVTRADEVGPGPVALTALARRGETEWTEILRTDILPPPPLTHAAEPGARRPGLHARHIDGDFVVLDTARVRGRKKGRFVLTGEFRAAQDGFHQLVVSSAAGGVRVQVGDVAAEWPRTGAFHVPLQLTAGWHPLRVEAPADVKLHFSGAQVCAPLETRQGTLPALKQQPKWERKQDGLLLSWKRTPKKIAAIVLVVPPKADRFPAKWIVERRVANRWKRVPARVVVTEPRSGGNGAPAYVEVHLQNPRAMTRLRLVCAGELPDLVGLEVLGEPAR